MEISYLNFKKVNITNPSEQKRGKAIYNPIDKTLSFVDENEESLFDIPLEKIKIQSECLLEKKLEFIDPTGQSTITVDCDESESLDKKSYDYLLNCIIDFQIKLAKENTKVDSKHIISSPKDYQLEILEKAKQRNTIVFLETGMGKTFISILLIKDIYGEPLECNFNNKLTYTKSTHKKVLFLFKTVSLLLQQSKVLKNNTNLKIIKLYGGQDVISCPPFNKFRSIINKYDIICATPETIYRYFTFGYLSHEDLSLIVLDECHHTKERDYYNLILKHYVQAFQSEVRILGLTASPSFDNEKSEEKINDNIQSLCNNMNCYLACPSSIIKDTPYQELTNESNNNSISNSTADKQVHFLFIDKFSDELNNKIKNVKFFLFKEIVHPILSNYLKEKILNTFAAHVENFEPIVYSALILTLTCSEDKIADKQIGVFEKEDLEELVRFSNDKILDKTFIDKFKAESEKSENEKINFSRELREFLKKFQDDFIIDSFRKYVKNINLILKYIDLESAITSSISLIQSVKLYYSQTSHKYDSALPEALHKINILKNNVTYKSSYLSNLELFFSQVISEIESTKEQKKTIIFLSQRNITKLLNDKLDYYLNKQGYCSRFVLGCQSNSNSTPFSEEELKSNIENFTNNQKCLVLLATNVVEEGIDVPQCNNVINLSEIRTIKEYIQKTGRARKADSKVFLCCDKSEESLYKDKIEQIKASIRVMKKIITENKLKPKPKKERYIKNVNFYQTEKGARVYLPYAKKMVEEFVGKLFFDGYTFLKSQMKMEDINDNGKVFYKPYLSLPYILESNFSKIFDTENTKFENKEEARIYFNKYEDYYYLTAVKLLHANNYFNDYLMFSKNYDELMNVEANCIKAKSEPQLKLKPIPKLQESDDETGESEVFAHVLQISPNFIDINYGSNEKKIIAVISDSPLTLINFDIYIHSTVLLKLYYLNTNFESEETLKTFNSKPKISYNVFTKINISMNEYQPVKFLKKDKHLINFFYTYLLFTSTDAELLFYYSVFQNKFDFSTPLFLDDTKTKNHLKYIFENYAENLPENKKHLVDFKNCKFDFTNHTIKYAILNKDEEGKLYFNINYIKSLLATVKEEIESYYQFLLDCVESEESINRIMIDEEFLKLKELELSNKRNDITVPSTGKIVRNMTNFGKMFTMHFGPKDIRGNTIYKNDMTYQKYYLQHFGLLTESNRDYKKCLALDYNQKILKYKINLNQVGKVVRHFPKTHHLKKFNFMPNETLIELNSFTIDELHMFTLFPVMLYKIQHSLIYYYQAFCLRQKFPSFKSLDQIDIRLLSQTLNAKTTLECENYERLEFVGDAVLKFLSTCEVMKLFPDANRDLLFSKRRGIETNKNLYKHAIDEKNQLDKFLFTSPTTIRRVRIPGFSNDEARMFNIGYNKSFAKSCFVNRQAEKVAHQKESNFNGCDVYSFINLIIEKTSINPDKIKDEELTDKTPISIVYEDNVEPVYASSEVLVDDQLIQDVNNKIEISYPSSIRIIYSKVLADLVESLTGFLMHSTLFSEGSICRMFDRSSSFLNEIGVLKSNFEEFFYDSFWLNNLKNENCRFNKDQKYSRVKPIAENGKYTFENLDLLYQACTHSSYISEESMKANFPYVKRSYQRLAFLGEAFISFYVSLWVYQMNTTANECLLHKLKICGINHHIISLIAIDLHLDDCLISSDKDINTDMKIYKNKFLESRYSSQGESESKFKIVNEATLDENFMIVLCEMFHAYIGAVLLDSKSVEITYLVLKGIIDDYLKANATLETFTEHPKVVILDNFMKRRNYFKKIRENGSNRVNMKNEKGEKFRKLKMYKYQLIIDKFIIYEEFIYYNRSTIKLAQEKAKEVFLQICAHIDWREKKGLHLKYFDLEEIIIHLGIPYEKTQL